MASSPTFSSTTTLEDLRAAMAAFVAERAWHKFHTPRNVLLALVGEVGEVAELFQWRGEVPVGLGEGDEGWSSTDRTHLGEELSDVLLYLVRLADLCRVDLPAAALRKMRRNAEKYPVDRCRGSSAKYTAYETAASSAPSSTSSSSSSSATASNDDALPAPPAVTPAKASLPPGGGGSEELSRASPTATLLSRFSAAEAAPTAAPDLGAARADRCQVVPLAVALLTGFLLAMALSAWRRPR